MTETRLCIMSHAYEPGRPRRAAPDSHLCRGHLAELVRTLGELPALDADLERAHTPGRGRAAEPCIPIDDDTARHRSHMTDVIASWCRALADETGQEPPADIGLGHTVPWLLTHIRACAGQPWAGDLLAEVRDLARTARSLTDIRARRVPLAARCLRHEGGQRCAGAVTIIVRGNDWAAVCDACETRQDATPYLRGVRGGRWITTEGVVVLARLFGLPASRDVVRQWHHRRRIIGRHHDGVTWYDLASVQRYLAARQRSAA